MPLYTPSTESQTETQEMQVLYFSNEFPRDDIQSLFRRLRTISKDRSHEILARFIDEATCTVRDEVRQLPASTKSAFPSFNTVFDLADYQDLRNGPLEGSVNGVLLCVLELATLICHYETSLEDFNSDSPASCITGLGLGLLAAAAVSVSPTLTDMPLAGAEVVRIAFRLGVLVHDVSQNLEPRDDSESPESWASVVPGVDPDEVQAELNAISAREKTPEPNKIFISALSRTSVTVSGPPSGLKHMFRMSEFFRGHKVVKLPVYAGLCHAPHIYNQEHAHQVVGFSANLEALDSQIPSPSPVISTCTGSSFTATKATELLEQVVHEILTRPIQWDNVINEVVQRAKQNVASEGQVLVFRNSLPVQELVGAMESRITDFSVSTREIIPSVAEALGKTTKPRGSQQSKIAIVGMACRMPGGATDNEKFWDLLASGMDVHRKIPPDRFDVDTHFDPTQKRANASWTPYGCFIDEPGLFDAPFFNMSPREAGQTDPMQRLALVTAYEALEQAGYVANRTPSTNLHRIGTFYGQASDDYREVNTAQNIDTYFIPGGCRAFGPGRINYFFKFSGPSFSCDTACSSSLATIQVACTSLWNGDVDTVVAGGMNVLTNSDAFAGLSRGHFLSKTPNACKTWDSTADGYCRADGVASVVLKRLEDAEADNDNILGVILGAATNHSAEAISITHPHAGAQAYLSRQVLSSAGIDPLDVSFVEMHGTGTQAGDSVEMESVSEVFAPRTNRRSSDKPLYVGAVKANVGHGEAVAGVTALVKVLCMYQKNMIPPHVGIKDSLNPALPKDLEKRGVRIPMALQQWAKDPSTEKRIAIVNNFSAAGGNSTIALEGPPVRKARDEAIDPRSTHVIAVSAKSKVSLQGNLERLQSYLDSHPDTSLADLSYTTTARRYHHNHRIAISASNIAEAKGKLGSHLGAVSSHKPIPANHHPHIAFVFTGQGSSHKSMNLELFHNAPTFRSQILQLDSLCQSQGLPSFTMALDGSHPKDHSHSPVVTQLALVAVEIAMAKYWASLGVRPSVVVGHSFGEYAALYIAGVLSASEVMYLVGQRAKLMESKCRSGSHKMVAVRASLAEIQEAAADLPYTIACINSPKDTVLSGPKDEMDALYDHLQKASYRCYKLDVEFAFHSAQMDPILDDFEQLAESSVRFRAPTLPVISPLLSKVVFDEKTLNAKYLRRATRETVDFVSALEMAQKVSTIDQDTVWVEIGPHPVCLNFVKATIPTTDIAVPSLRREESNWATMAQSLATLHSSCAGIPVEWNEYHRSFEAAGALRLLDLPTYSWNDKNHWIMYNGDWALTKGNNYYDEEKGLAKASGASPVPKSNLGTSTVHCVVEERFDGVAGRVVMQSDLSQPELRAAAWGHKINNCGVVTSSIHADIAYTLGGYLYKKLKPGDKEPAMNVANLEVLKGLVANDKPLAAQLIQVSLETVDINSATAELKWYNLDTNGAREEPFASAQIIYGDSTEWLASWAPLAHLIESRIEGLQRLADSGVANRFSHKMAYNIFANNLVDYADEYRGIQSVVLNGLEAYSDVTLTMGKSGTWTVPPHFIDSVAHLAGFVMNVSDSIDTKNNFCVTPGWRTMRFAKPLTPGARYRAYVKMIPQAEDPTTYLGDVYILQDGIIMGMVGAIKFRRYPRILLSRFFSAPDDHAPHASRGAAPVSIKAKQEPSCAQASAQQQKPPADVQSQPTPAPAPVVPSSTPAPATVPEGKSEPTTDDDSVAARAVTLIAREAGLDQTDMKDDVSFSALGVDSLMSLVIAEKFREELGVTVSGSLFLEYPTVGDLKQWLLEYYS